MTASAGKLFVKPRSSTSSTSILKSPSQHLLKRHRRQANLIIPRRSSTLHLDHSTMSKALIRELDLKMQQVKEYGLIAHGYHNENFQYPTHVRRSHDGEKGPSRTLHFLDQHHRTIRLPNSTILTSSSQENQTGKSSTKKSTPVPPDDYRTFVVPPNRTVNDIDPTIDREQSYTTGQSLTRLYHRKSSSSSSHSSPVLCSLRPHSIACLASSETLPTAEPSTTKATDDVPTNLFSDSSQSLINTSSSSSTSSTSRTPIRSMTQKFFSKLFHHPSKS